MLDEDQPALRRLAGRRRLRRRRLRQLRVAARLHVRHLPEAARRGIRLVARSGLGGLRHRRHDGRRLLAAARLPARSGPPAPGHRPLPDRLRLRVRLAVAADAAPVAPLRRLRRARRGRQRHRADGVFARRVELVRSAARHGAGAGHVGRRGRRDGAAAAGRRAHPDASAGAAPTWRSAGWSLAIGVPTVAALHPRAAGRGVAATTSATAGSLGSRGDGVARLLDSGDRALLQLDRAERRDRAHLGAADRSRRLGGRRRAGALRDGRREPGRPARDRMAARSLLRRARVVRAARARGARHVPARRARSR